MLQTDQRHFARIPIARASGLKHAFSARTSSEMGDVRVAGGAPSGFRWRTPQAWHHCVSGRGSSTRSPNLDHFDRLRRRRIAKLRRLRRRDRGDERVSQTRAGQRDELLSLDPLGEQARRQLMLGYAPRPAGSRARRSISTATARRSSNEELDAARARNRRPRRAHPPRRNGLTVVRRAPRTTVDTNSVWCDGRVGFV
jgi:hypothetical protein